VNPILKRLTPALALMAVLAAGCGGGGDNQTPDIVGAGEDCPTDGELPTSKRPTSTGSITIVEPERGELVEGDSVTVKIELEGACLLEEAQREVRPDTGHMHLTLDSEVVTLLAGLEFTIDDVGPGSHLLQAEFSAADHGPFDPPVVQTVQFRVAP
jgi:hypothetical protein